MPTSDWSPTVAGVGSHIRARTKDSNGNELGTFTANTRPTDAQVQDLLDTAAQDVADQIGWDIPQVFWSRASHAVELAAALLVELSYYPEQVGTKRSPYNELKELHDDRLARLEAAIAIWQDTGGLDEGEVPSSVPAYGFPADAGGFVGWRTRWHHEPRRTMFDTCCWERPWR